MAAFATTDVEPNEAVCPETQLTVEVVSDESSFHRLEPVWNRLVEEANLGHPFLTYLWVRTWWECFGPGRKLHILVVKDQENVVGIAPLMLTQRRIYGVTMRCLEFLANVHTPRFDIIVHGSPLPVYRAIWDQLQAQKDLWDLLLLCQIPEGSATLEQFSGLAEAARLPVGCWHSSNSPFLAIQGDWAGYLKELKSKHVRNLYNRYRRLLKDGQVSLEIVPAGEMLDRSLEDGFRLEGAAWKDGNGTSIRSQPAVRQFYAQLARECAALGKLYLCFLKCNERRIAFHYSIAEKDKLYLLKPGYDPAYAQYSPGSMLCLLVLEEAFRTGFQEFDFLGVDDEWKRQWTQNKRPHYWLFVFSKGPLTSLLYFLKFRLLPFLQRRSSYRIVRIAVVTLQGFLGPLEPHL